MGRLSGPAVLPLFILSIAFSNSSAEMSESNLRFTSSVKLGIWRPSRKLVCWMLTPEDFALYNDWKNWVKALVISCGSDERVPELVIMLLMALSDCSFLICR